MRTLLFLGFCALLACGSAAAPPDAGPAPTDGGRADGGAVDGGLADGGVDGGVADGGVDAGPFELIGADPPVGYMPFRERSGVTFIFSHDVDAASVSASSFYAERTDHFRDGSRTTTRFVGTTAQVSGSHVTINYPFPDSTTGRATLESASIVATTALRDTAGNSLARDARVTYPQPRSYLFTPLEPNDATRGGYSTEGTVFEYGAPDAGPGRGGWIRDAQDAVWSTGLSGQYPISQRTVRDGGFVMGVVPLGRIISPPVDLRDAGTPALDFAHVYDLGTTDPDIRPFWGTKLQGRVEVETGTDGGWQLLLPLGNVGSPQDRYYRQAPDGFYCRGFCAISSVDGGADYLGAPQYRRDIFDLRPFIGRVIRLSFRLFTEAPGSVHEQRAGWYIDDLEVRDHDPALLGPDGGSDGGQ